MKVLVVDDDVVSRMMLMHLVDSCGSFELTEAEDGEEAWHLLRDGLRPAMVFCDLRMPRLSGMELLQKVRADAALAALPFVLVTSASDRETVEQATQAGATGYVVKPFDAASVREQLAVLASPADAPAADAEAELAAEDPAATLTRLGIDSGRLQAYLGGLAAQLRVAGTEVTILYAQGDRGAAQERLERLRAGCATLGLHGAAAALTHPPVAERALAVALDAVLDQAERAAALS